MRTHEKRTTKTRLLTTRISGTGKKSGTGFVLVEESIKKKRKGRKRQFLEK
jgi:hypothetical protein